MIGTTAPATTTTAMSLVPARLLLPIRSLEPANPGSLCCSCSPHFSLFFFHTPYNRPRRGRISVTARIYEETPSRRHNPSFSKAITNNSFGRQQEGEVHFDDLRALYEEEQGFATGNVFQNENSSRIHRDDAPRFSQKRFPEGNGTRINGKPWSSSAGSKSPPWNLETAVSTRREYRGTLGSSFDSRKIRNRPRQVEYSKEHNDSQWQDGQRFGRSTSSWRDELRRENASEEHHKHMPWQSQQRQLHGDAGRRHAPGRQDQHWCESVDEENCKHMPWKSQQRQLQGDAQGDEFQHENVCEENQKLRPWGPQQRQLPGDAQKRHAKHWKSGSHRQQPLSTAHGENAMSSNSTVDSNFGCEFHGEAEADSFWQGSYSAGGNSTEPIVSEGSFSRIENFPNETSWQKNHYMGRETGSKHRAEQNRNGNASQNNSAITRIMERLRDIQDQTGVTQTEEGFATPRSHLADSLSLPGPDIYLKGRSMRQQFGSESEKREHYTTFPWETENSKEETNTNTQGKVGPLTLAELTIPAPELRRLRILSLHLKQRVKIGKHGVSKDIVSSIKQRWCTCEVVKIKCEGQPAGNMKKTLEVLEEKTGGLVIWKAGSVAVLYRGKDFGQPVSEIVDNLLEKKLEKLKASDSQNELDSDQMESSSKINTNASDLTKESDISQENALSRSLKPDYNRIEEYNREIEDILTGIGLKYEDWTGPKPVPVDADLLPVIPNYRPPFRLLPYGVRQSLGNILSTHLRRISRNLAPHFVIGRDRELQGLASAIVKLWEKSEIAKVGFKRGILNTNQERVAEDIKQLTGGSILCRDKQSVTFYRGKDFLPEQVAAALSEREAMAEALQNEEGRVRADRSISVQQGTEPVDAKLSWVQLVDPEERIRLKREAAKARRTQIIQHLERKIKMALRKKEKAERELEKVEEFLKPVDQPEDKETITEEERFMLKKLGLKMKAFLLVGRRGVFSGVVQNMHLHWKHRELVKVIIKERDPVQLKKTAAMLENESGGILIAVEPTSKGHAIIVYRGKNYSRPPQLRPPNLLTKRLALKRSLEVQRRQSLSRHIQTLEEEIVHLRAGLSKMNNETGICHKGENGHSHNSSTDSLLQDEAIHPQESDLNEVRSVSFTACGSDIEMDRQKISKWMLRRLSEMGPVFRAQRLSLRERHEFRNEVENLSKAAQFLVGRSKPLTEIARGIRVYFLDHAFAKIGVRGRPPGTSVQDIAEELEDLTGGTVYAQDMVKVILYRGWPSGKEMPTSEIYDVLSLEQCDIMEEDSLSDDLVHEPYSENMGNSDNYQNDQETDSEDDEISNQLTHESFFDDAMETDSEEDEISNQLTHESIFDDAMNKEMV